MNSVTVNEAIEQLTRLQQQGYGEQPLAIPYDHGGFAIGARPTVAVKGLSGGIDWDQGKVLVGTEKLLGLPESELRKKLQAAADEHAKLVLSLRQVLRSPQEDADSKLAQIGALITPPVATPRPKR